MQPRGQYVPELQSLRGIAACTVMIHHALRTIENTRSANWIAEYALNAHAAVVVFFVLSGYVLSPALSQPNNVAPNISAFWIRRIFRIYPALILCCIFGLIYLLTLSPIHAPGESAWMAEKYALHAYSTPSAIRSLLGLDGFLLPQSWTITVEIAASIFLPFIVLFMSRSNTLLVVAIIALTATSLFAGVSLRQIPLYLICFAAGALPALRPKLFHSVGPEATLVAALVLLVSRYAHPWPYHAAIPSLIETAAACILIAGIAQIRPAFMRNALLLRVGDWSYSIYLIHIPLCFVIAKIVLNYGGARHPDFAAGIVAFATTALSIPLSAFIFRWIETPPIALSKKASRKFSRIIGQVEQRAARSHP